MTRRERPSERVMAEWQSAVFRGETLTPADRRLVASLLAEDERRLTVEELRDGVRVVATSWVGVVRFEGWELHVVPKLAGDELGLIELIEFTKGLDTLRRVAGARDLAAEGRGLFDLIGLLFAEAVDRLLSGGLSQEYVEREDDLRLVRGKILVARQVLRHFGRVDRVACRFDERDSDTTDNRLLAVALRWCVGRVRHEGVKRRLVRLLDVFEQVCEPERLDLAEARHEIYYDRLNAHYREAHGLAWLVIEGLGIQDVLQSGATRCFAFLINMNLLFEDFVHRLVRQLFGRRQEYRIRYQHGDRSILWNVDRNQSYGRVIPDLLVEALSGSRLRVPVDAKYKLYDERKLSADDVYQSFLYAYAFSREAGSVRPRSILVYPASGSAVALTRLGVRSAGEAGIQAEIVAIGIPVVRALGEAKADRLGPVGKALQEAILGVATPSARLGDSA